MVYLDFAAIRAPRALSLVILVPREPQAMRAGIATRTVYLTLPQKISTAMEFTQQLEIVEDRLGTTATMDPMD
jgi:hypothetical protein